MAASIMYKASKNVAFLGNISVYPNKYPRRKVVK